jgi:hypothetical protein
MSKLDPLSDSKERADAKLVKSLPKFGSAVPTSINSLN